MGRFRKNWKRLAGLLTAVAVTAQSGGMAAAQETQREEAEAGRTSVWERWPGVFAEAQSEALVSPEGEEEASGNGAEELYGILRRQREEKGESLLERTIGFDRIFEAVKKQGLTVTAEFGMTEGTAEALNIPAEIAEGGRVSINTQVDPKLRKWLFEEGAALGEIPVLELSLYGDQEKLAVSVPQIFEGAIALGSGSLEEQYTGSVLEQILGEYPEELPDVNLDFFPEMEDVNLDFFPEMEDVTGSYHLTEEWEKAVEEGAEQLRDSLQAEVEEQEGQQVYRISCETKKALEIYQDLMEEYCSLLMGTGLFSMNDIWEMEEELKEGFDMAEQMLEDKITVAYYVAEGQVERVRFALRMDGNQMSAGDIAAGEDESADHMTGESQTEAPYDPDQDVTLDFDLLYRNPAAPEEGFDLTVKGMDGTGTEQAGVLLRKVTENTETASETTMSLRLEELGEVIYQREFLRYGYDTVTGDFDIIMSIQDGEEETSFVLDSTFTDVENGKHVTWNIDQLSVCSEGERAGVKGSVTLEAGTGNIPEPQNVRMLLELTQEQFSSLLTEIEVKAASWAQQFEGQPETETEEMVPSNQ